jgi:hypothetical protein
VVIATGVRADARGLSALGGLDDESVAGSDADAAGVQLGVDDRVGVEVDDLDLEAVAAVELGDVIGGTTGHGVGGHVRGS